MILAWLRLMHYERYFFRLWSILKSWDDAIPYSVLCNVFVEKEERMGRLQIQDKLTNLFCQILLKHHHHFVRQEKQLQ